MRRLPAGTLVPLSRNTFIAIPLHGNISPPKCASLSPPGHAAAPFRAQAAAISLPGNISPPKCARLSPPGHAPAPFCAQATAISLHGNVSPPKCARLPPPGHAPAPFRAQAAGIFLFVKFGGITCHCQTAFYKGVLLPLRQFCSGRNTIPSQTALPWG